MKNYIDFHPGTEVAEEHRSWQGCPTIAVTRSGRLFAGWYTGGMMEPCIDNYNVLVKSDDGGETWSKPILAVYSDRTAMIRHLDIELWVDDMNRLWVMWTCSPYYEDSQPMGILGGQPFNYHREFTNVELMLCNDPDADELIWEEVRYLTPGFQRNHPIVLSDGRYLSPAYDYQGMAYTLHFSEDKGESFTSINACTKPKGLTYDETIVYEYDGVLHLRARTNLGYYAGSESYDGGKTWTAAYAWAKGPSTRLYMGVLKNGTVAMVRSISDTERTGMKLCLSKDGGETWFTELVLDERKCLSYPELAEGDDGYLYILYDRERDNRNNMDRESRTSEGAKEILLAKINLEEAMSGSLGCKSILRRIVSKGGMTAVIK